MERQQLIEEINYIKQVISSSTHYTNLSGTAAIISGVAALVGCLVSFYLPEQAGCPCFNFKLIAIWLAVFIISVTANIYFIIRKAKKTGQPAWSRLTRLILFALSPPLLIGGILTIFFVLQNNLIWIPATWMISYGMGVWSAALFSISEPRWLGAAFMLIGLITLFFFHEINLVMLSISFGVFHIIYGLRLLLRYGG